MPIKNDTTVIPAEQARDPPDRHSSLRHLSFFGLIVMLYRMQADQEGWYLLKAQRDFTYQAGPRFRRKGTYRIRLWPRPEGKTLVLVSERSDNPGMSVTNAFEAIATSLVKDIALDASACLWVEHYPQEGMILHGRNLKTFAESFDLVTLTWDKHQEAHDPEWQRLTRFDWESLIGEPWTPEVISAELVDEPYPGS